MGEAGGIANAMQDPLFDPLDVIRLTIVHEGSAGVDNLAFVPAPSALLVVLAGLVGIRRRRRTWSDTILRACVGGTWRWALSAIGCRKEKATTSAPADS